MKLIKPISIDSTKLISTNVTDSTQVYSAGTSYVTGDIVQVEGTINKLYEALQSSTGYYPPSYTGGEAPYWLELSANNIYKAFDSIVGDVVTGTTSITYTIIPGEEITSVAVLNIVGSLVEITVTDPIVGQVYYNSIWVNDTSVVYDWYSYFFADFVLEESISDNNLTTGYPNSTITITVSGAAGSAIEVGEIILGTVYNIGDTTPGVSIGIIDYSKKDTDDYGNFIVIPRGYSKRLNCNTIIQTADLNSITSLLTSIRAIPCVWLAIDTLPALPNNVIVYGYIKDYSIKLPHILWGELDIQIEGLT